MVLSRCVFFGAGSLGWCRTVARWKTDRTFPYLRAPFTLGQPQLNNPTYPWFLGVASKGFYVLVVMYYHLQSACVFPGPQDTYSARLERHSN